MSRGQSHPGSRKSERRIRTDSGEIKGLPGDLHDDLCEQKVAHGYPSMWSTAIQAMRHGVKVLRAQHDRTNEIINAVGNRFNASGTGRNN